MALPGLSVHKNTLENDSFRNWLDSVIGIYSNQQPRENEPMTWQNVNNVSIKTKF
jgi:hypothetical protein